MHRSFAALADPTRHQLFERLAKRSYTVAELHQGLDISRPAVSQHLKVLKDAGLVMSVQSGRHQHYQADPKGVEAMRAYLDGMWTHALANFKAFVESGEN